MSAIATALTEVLRRFLARRGYVVSHLEAGIPVRVETYLAALAGRGIALDRICAFDSDRETLNAFLRLFEAPSVHFQSDPKLEKLPPLGGKEKLLVEADLEVLRPPGHSALLPHLQQAAIVIIRGKLSRFWAGEADLYALAALMAEHGLIFQDVLLCPSETPLSGPTGNVFLAFERGQGRPEETDAGRREREFRISEALTLLGAPVVPESSLRRLTGRSSYGFAAGLSNPGALYDGEKVLLLARGERFSWPLQKRSRARYLSSCQPVLLALGDGDDRQISTATEVRFADSGSAEGYRFEDFRVFAHQGRVYSNHSAIRYGPEHGESVLVRPERLQTAVWISQFEPEKALLTPLGPPTLDRPIAPVEKNWAMFSTGDRLHLIYSFTPYRLFSCAAVSDLRFAAAIERPLDLPLPRDGLYLRNSINPIPWDEKHLLHIVHKVFPDKRYVFWAVLIDRHSLLPVKVSRRPLLSGKSSSASITYACSALCRADELLLFGGLDDCAIGAWHIPKAHLDSQWLAIA